MKKIKCKYCGRELVSRGHSVYCSRACARKAYEKRINEKLTLCWSCKNACGGCEWSAFFIPVKGWRAKKTEIKNLHMGTAYTSYHVYECPRFAPDRVVS